MSDKLYSPLIQDPLTNQFYKHELDTHTGIVVRTQGGHCYINGSETTLTENLIKQRDQYKAERDTLIDDIAVLKADNEKYRKRAENAMDYAERSQCEVLRLERENKKLSSLNDVKDNAFKGADRIIKNQKHENKALRLQSNTYFDEWQNEKLTSQGLREQYKEYVQDTSKYTTLTDHIRTKAEHNPGVSRYIDLVNYIDRLEKGDN